MLRTIVSDRIEVIPVLLHSRASFRASTERVTYSEVDGVVEHSIGGIKWDASNKCHIPSVLRDVMASITPAETITGKSERASPPNLDISTPWPFHISLIWKKKKYRQLSVLRVLTLLFLVLDFPLSAILGGQKYSQYTHHLSRTGFFPENTNTKHAECGPSAFTI